jgi:hypothetical protein
LYGKGSMDVGMESWPHASSPMHEQIAMIAQYLTTFTGLLTSTCGFKQSKKSKGEELNMENLVRSTRSISSDTLRNLLTSEVGTYMDAGVCVLLDRLEVLGSAIEDVEVLKNCVKSYEAIATFAICTMQSQPAASLGNTSAVLDRLAKSPFGSISQRAQVVQGMLSSAVKRASQASSAPPL